jgi:nitrogen regulatory protein PII
MDNNIKTLLTIITELTLEKTITKELKSLGARGYTITNARGRGTRGARRAEWDIDSNIRIEVVCKPEVARAIETSIQEKYYDDYGMIIFSSEVSVLRPDKF